LILLVAIACASLATDAAADDPPVSVRLELPVDAEGHPTTIRVGDRTVVIAIVSFARPNDEPLLLTPQSEGSPIEVARGRLLRDDADEETERELRFRVPLVARARGAARLRVHVATWECDEACRRIEARGEISLRVHDRP
jgi:hypothetical protein